jgi:hypothetical protein
MGDLDDPTGFMWDGRLVGLLGLYRGFRGDVNLTFGGFTGSFVAF